MVTKQEARERAQVVLASVDRTLVEPRPERPPSPGQAMTEWWERKEQEWARWEREQLESKERDEEVGRQVRQGRQAVGRPAGNIFTRMNDKQIVEVFGTLIGECRADALIKVEALAKLFAELEARVEKLEKRDE
ncbi:hypothetical protein [Paracoccus litorisediminis]|uniref:Uncharacterized protein n=1 Tax=Paracoccus litorisediminis TaxID=2006130 RepID=A0A844HKT8_9RHOB|nr:hypothetical protein [Paracoccus litorisediminis]MTH58997.1 hypothetical protein [Paracoccus litorisediminis]